MSHPNPEVTRLMGKLAEAWTKYLADERPARKALVTRYRNRIEELDPFALMHADEMMAAEWDWHHAESGPDRPLPVVDAVAVPIDDEHQADEDEEMPDAELHALAVRNRARAAAAHTINPTPESLARLVRLTESLARIERRRSLAVGPSPDREPVEPPHRGPVAPPAPPMAMRYGSPSWSASATAHTARSLAWFRLQLNARAWPKPVKSSERFGSVHAARQARRAGIADAKAHAERMKAQHAAHLALARRTSTKHDPEVLSLLDQARRLQDARITALRTQYAAPDHAQHVGRWWAPNGFQTVEPFTSRPAPSDRRPMAAFLVWQTWLKDGERMLCLVAQPKTGKIVTETKERTIVRPGQVTDWWVTLAETQTVACRTDRELADVNARYFARGVPLVARVASWRVLEPIEDVIGPFRSEDDARQAMGSWQSELDDDYADNHERGSGLVYLD